MSIFCVFIGHLNIFSLCDVSIQTISFNDWKNYLIVKILHMFYIVLFLFDTCIVNSFSYSVACLFIFLMIFFKEHLLKDILIMSISSNFISWFFFLQSKKIFLYMPKSQRLSPMISSRSSTFLDFTLKSIIQFKVIFVYSAK